MGIWEPLALSLMDSLLKKTIASLETALRYNPENLELMTSLAEGYVRSGRFDEEAIELCEKVLDRSPDNRLLARAQTVAFVIEQADQIDLHLIEGRPAPPPEDVESSMSMLDEFLSEVGECEPVWIAKARLGALAGDLRSTLLAVEKLTDTDGVDFSALTRALDWAALKLEDASIHWRTLLRVYELIGEHEMGIRRLETNFDRGHETSKIGRILLRHYLHKYTPAKADEVPEDVRPRLFQALLDFGDPEKVAEWLAKATLFGWEITNYSKIYVKELMDAHELEAAVEVLKRMSMDEDVRGWLNGIAETYEEQDRVDEALEILRFINKKILNDEGTQDREEMEMTREMEISLAELAVKNGRLDEALMKYTAALCLSPSPVPEIIERIDEILAHSVNFEVAGVLRIASYFRAQGDYPKTIFYLNRLLAQEPQNTGALEDLQDLFGEILKQDPNNPDIHLEMGKLYIKLGQYERASSELELAFEEPGLERTVARYLGRSYLGQDLLDDALAQYQHADISKDDFESIYELYEGFIALEDNDSALTAVDLIHMMDPGYRDVSRRRGELLPSGEGGLSNDPGDVRMRELIGELAIGRYRHIEKIGSGGMGVVYKITDLRQKKIMAMKILRDSLGGSSKALDRFFREARIAASINSRNIVEIFDYNISRASGQSFICMEFVDGPSLREVIDDQYDDGDGATDEFVKEMLYYAVQLLGALTVTHENGIVHRDIKPDNIMITTRGEVKITDFGIVHVEEATFTPTGAMLGTPRYMSPEQVTGGRIDGRSDIYSVGILLYELLSGSPPFVSGDIAYQQINKDPVPLIEVNPNVSPRVNEIVMQCLEKTPDDRFESAEIARVQVDEALTQLGGCEKYQSKTVDGGETYHPPARAEVPSSIDEEVPLAIKSNFDSHPTPKSRKGPQSDRLPGDRVGKPGPPNPADYFERLDPQPSAEASEIKESESAA